MDYRKIAQEGSQSQQQHQHQRLEEVDEIGLRMSNGLRFGRTGKTPKFLCSVRAESREERMQRWCAREQWSRGVSGEQRSGKRSGCQQSSAQEERAALRYEQLSAGVTTNLGTGTWALIPCQARLTPEINERKKRTDNIH